jgi:glucose/arabinose dehydrogenase
LSRIVRICGRRSTDPIRIIGRLLLLVGLMAGGISLGGCGGAPDTERTDGATGDGRAPGQLPDTLETLDYKLATEVVAQGLIQPWAIAFVGPDTALVTEQPGRLRLLIDGTLRPDSVTGTPEVLYDGQGGLLDVAVDPNYDDNGWVYLTYSHALEDREGTPSMTRVVRGRVRNGTWRDQQVVFEAPYDTYRTTRIQYGTRMTFGPEGHLYFSIGDRGAWPVDTTTVFAQHLDRPGGKVYRVHRDGSIPEDNPFVDRDDALEAIYTYGHRNPQGLDTHPRTGTIWATEHGPRGGDELNRLRVGQNYGWPTITYGINYPGDIITRKRRKEGLEQPVFFWRPSIATSGFSFYEGDAFPYWQNQGLVSALKDQSVRLLTMAEGRVLHQEVILKGAGRVREAVPGPDGAVYVVLNAPSRVVRIHHAADHTARRD